MKANLKTGFIWASHALLLVGLPLIWLYSFFINKEVFYTIGTIIDSVQQPMDYLWGFPIGMALIIFTFYPLAYVFILFAYSVFETNVFKFLSFHYVQNNGLLRNKQYLYDTTFSVLERVLDEKNYEQHPLFYDFTYQTRPEKVAFTFHEKTQDKTWQLVMGESYFYLKTLSKVEHASEFVTPKVHDQKIYQMYYETL